MISRPEVRDWLSHRYGEVEIVSSESISGRKALQLNENGPTLIETFGEREFHAFAGFVDLVDFSDRTQGKPAMEVARYVKPFLEGVINDVLHVKGFIDKTIGDEVMFILPDRQDVCRFPPWIFMGQLLGAMYDRQKKLGTDYPMRIGLSYGTVFLDAIRGEGYQEYTVFGETVNLAKRLHSLCETDFSRGLGGAFGVLLSDSEACNLFSIVLGYIAGIASRMDHTLIENPPELRGISAYKCALLTPKPSSRQVDSHDA